MKVPIFIFLTLLLSYARPIPGQVKDDRNEPVTSCEENEAKLDQIGKIVADDGDNTNLLVVIAHLGKGESSADLVNRRLYNVTEYLRLRSPSVSPKRIVIARGLTTGGLGRIDFHFKGKIIMQLFTTRMKTLCVDCCTNSHITPYKSRFRNKNWKDID